MAFILTLLGMGVFVCEGAPSLPNIPTNVYSVLNFGAYGNGTSNNTTAIQSCINTAALTGGTVEIPANGTLSTYLCGAISLKSSINLQIDSGAMLKMLPYGVYPTNSPPDFIAASSLHDIEISGSGTIDGQGAVWWATNNAASSGIARPKAMFAPSACTRVLVQNVTLQNPPNTHISFRSSNHVPCGDVTVTNITINTPDGTPNTDGMDMSVTNALVIGSYISDGDDHIAMGDSSAFNGGIVVTNCIFGTGHGVSIGSYTTGGLSNLLVVNCMWNGSENGIRLKSQRGRGGPVQNLTYLNLSMTNVQWPIMIYSYYAYGVGTLENANPYMASTDVVQTVTSTTPIWRNITFSNVTATTTSGRPPIMIWGLPEMLVSNVTLDQVRITGADNCEVYNASAIQFLDSQLTLPSNTNTFVLYNTQLSVTNSVASGNRVTIGGLAAPPTNNVLSFFNGSALITDTNELGAGLFTLDRSTLTFSRSAVTFSNNISAIGASTLILSNGTDAVGGALDGPALLTVILTNSGALRLNQGANTWGGSNAIFSAGSSGTINNSAPGNINIFLGALSGSSGAKLRGSDQAGPGLDSYVIGNLGSNTIFAGTISDGTGATSPHVVSLVEVGTGTLTLSGSNTYSGGTTVGNGTVLVNNSTGSGTGTGAVVVASSGTLCGTGVVGGPVKVDGTLAPGNSVGALTISNNLVLDSGAVLQYQLGTNSDLTVVSGNLTLGGTLNITDAGGFTNTTYTLFRYGGTLTTNGSPEVLAIGNTPDTNKIYALDISTPNQVNLIVGIAAPPLDPFAAWQLQYFGCTNCANAQPNADPLGKGMSNTNQFLVGLNPTNPASQFQIISTTQNTTDVVIVWKAAGARTNAVQAASGAPDGSYNTNGFADISGPIVIGVTGDTTTNYTDAGGVTNVPSRFYRVRLVP